MEGFDLLRREGRVKQLGRLVIAAEEVGDEVEAVG